MTYIPRNVGVRSLALGVLMLSACRPDVVSAPDVPDDFLVTSEAGKRVGQDGGTVSEPSRFIQTRLYPAGALVEFGGTNAQELTRKCYVNSYEDRDGNDFISVDPALGYRNENVTESDGFVMIWERSAAHPIGRVTHIGRSSWSGQFWFDTGVPNDPTAHVTSMDSWAQGALVPIAYPSPTSTTPSDPDMAELLAWLDAARDGNPAYSSEPAVPGSYIWVNAADVPAGATVYAVDGDRRMIGSKPGPGVDLLNDPLGIMTVHPDPEKVGTEGRAVGRLAMLMARYESDLVGVDCRVQATLVGFGVGGVPIYSALKNDVVLEKTWPKQLKKTF